MELLYKILCATEPLRPEPDEPVYVFDGIGKILVGWVLFAGTPGLLGYVAFTILERSTIDPESTLMTVIKWMYYITAANSAYIMYRFFLKTARGDRDM